MVAFKHQEMLYISKFRMLKL